MISPFYSSTRDKFLVSQSSPFHSRRLIQWQFLESVWELIRVLCLSVLSHIIFLFSFSSLVYVVSSSSSLAVLSLSPSSHSPILFFFLSVTLCFISPLDFIFLDCYRLVSFFFGLLFFFVLRL